ncbi:MAG TPA: hypothetical protein PLX18_11030 [Anaerohalosphaeraceae bacterium]|nr:hypothetical protein [Anaerohalosphaeraceae bacterium]HQI08373.1 hypothetical protein [Anaerohalosphaeraceae bacterium]
MGINLQPCCVGHWKLNDDGPSRVALDAMGCYHGILARPASEMSIEGKIGKALAFNGVDDCVRLSGSLQDVWRHSFTICGWVRRVDCDAEVNQPIWGILAPYFANFIEINERSDEIWLVYVCDQKATICKATAIPAAWWDNQWCFIMVMADFDARIAELYFNGDQIQTVSVASGTNPMLWESPHDFVLGAGIYATGEVYAQRPLEMDNVMIFNRALTEAEREFLWNGGEGREVLVEAAAGVLTQVRNWAVGVLAAVEDGGQRAFKTVEPWIGQIGGADGGISSFARYAPFAFVRTLADRVEREGDGDADIFIHLDIVVGAADDRPGVCLSGSDGKLGTDRLIELVIMEIDRQHPGKGVVCDDFYLTDCQPVWIRPQQSAVQLHFVARWIHV